MEQLIATMIFNKTVTCRVSTVTMEPYVFIQRRYPEAEEGETHTCRVEQSLEGHIKGGWRKGLKRRP